MPPGELPGGLAVLLQQVAKQFAQVGEKQCAHSGMEATCFLAANGQQSTGAPVTEWYEGYGLDGLCLVTEQVLELLGFEASALRP